MSRHILARWCLDLTAEQGAAALAAAALFGPLIADPDAARIARIVTSAQKGLTDILPVQLSNIARLVGALQERTTGELQTRRILDAEAYARVWSTVRDLWRTLSSERPPLLRLELDPRVPIRIRSAAPGPLWLLSAMLRSSEVADAAYVRVDEPDRPVAWEWPLRVGVLDDLRSRELGEALRKVQWPHLVKIVAVEATNEDCDLLILPYALRPGLARLFETPKRLRADCVLLMQGADVAGDRRWALLSALRREVLTSGVGVLIVEPPRYTAWFDQFVMALSHDLPLDRALMAARTASGGPPDTPFPVLVASRRLAMTARTKIFARRLARQLRRMAPPRRRPATGGRSARPLDVQPTAGGSVPQGQPTFGTRISHLFPDRSGLRSMAATIEEHASLVWEHESGPSTDVVNTRIEAETTLGSPIVVTPQGARATPPSKDQPEHRRVSFILTDVTAQARVSVATLTVGQQYEIELFIALPRFGVTSAPAVFPSDKLPASRVGHTLEVFFVPLSADIAGYRAEPQHATIFLPPEGGSTTCRFAFTTTGISADYRARVIVSFGPRVIQTLRFVAGIGTDIRTARLELETLVTPHFNDLTDRPPMDAAIIVNHSDPGDVPGITTVVGGEVTFREPVGLDRIIGSIQKIISDETSLPEANGRLDDPALVKVLAALAEYGKAIWELLPANVRPQLAAATRIQVVEARAGAYLPVEFFHSQRLPDEDATMCPDAQQALVAEKRHEDCPHREDPKHHCPLRLWGFNRVIERQPPLAMPAGADYQIQVPTPTQQRLDVFKCGLAAHSARVRSEDFDEPSGVVAAVRNAVGSLTTAATWTDWKTQIQATSPTLLVLLPHSQEAPGMANIPALEIGGAYLSATRLEDEYVIGPEATPPVVLLLGCSTQLPDVPFLNFVHAFKAKRAALVVGTLATIRGRRTVDFVATLLSQMKAQAGTDKTFGDVFLESKRRLLAKGDSFALSLVGYGDVGWRL